LWRHVSSVSNVGNVPSHCQAEPAEALKDFERCLELAPSSHGDLEEWIQATKDRLQQDIE
jgi:hypothetical protein